MLSTAVLFITVAMATGGAMVGVPSRVERIDPFSEEEYWDTIKDNKVVDTVHLDQDNAVNTPPAGNHLKVVCISDTHDLLEELSPSIPDGDVLIHAGDFTNKGDREKLEEFNRIMARLPHRHKLVVAGNHELGFDDNEDMTQRDSKWIDYGTPKGYELLTNVTYLQDKAVEIDGVHFYGASWHPLAGYPFYRRRADQMADEWKKIPDQTDILITHTPALGYLDLFNAERWGCRNLLQEIEDRVKPKYHIFGHVHACYGTATNGITTFINAAQCGTNNRLLNKPIIFYIPIPKKEE